MDLKKIGLFAGGVLFGTAGIKALSSKDAKKAYTQTTAAAGAQAINEQRAGEECCAVIEDASEEDAEETCDSTENPCEEAAEECSEKAEGSEAE